MSPGLSHGFSAGPSPTRRERPAVASACHGAQGIHPSMEDAHAVIDELEIGPLGGIGIGRQCPFTRQPRARYYTTAATR